MGRAQNGACPREWDTKTGVRTRGKGTRVRCLVPRPKRPPKVRERRQTGSVRPECGRRLQHPTAATSEKRRSVAAFFLEGHLFPTKRLSTCPAPRLSTREASVLAYAAAQRGTPSCDGMPCDLRVDQVVNDRTEGLRRDLDDRQGYRQLEAPASRASGIQIQHSIDLIDLRDMRMA
jgi:hypothetical protein